MPSSWRLDELAHRYSSAPPSELPGAPGGCFLLVRELERDADADPPTSAYELSRAEAAPDSTLVFALPTKVTSTSDGPSPGTRLGRGAGVELRLDHPSISNEQLVFSGDLASGSLQVTESGSRHGSTLNGAALGKGRPCPLAVTDVLELSHQLRAIVVSARVLHACLQRCGAPAQGRDSAESSAPRRLLRGKVAIITGAGRGLGRAYALRFAREGCRVVVNDVGAAASGMGRDEQVSAAVAAEIRSTGGIALATAHDVTRADDVEALLAETTASFGGVDILVCSAGAMHAGSSLLRSSEDTWQRLLNVNVMGAFRCIQAVAKQLIASGRGGRIITTSSLVGLQGAAGLVEYAASKAAVIGMSKTAALELAPHGITVNVLLPVAWTRLTQAIPAIASIPNVEQVLSPDRIADVAAFLASDLAEGVSGHVVDVGGAHLSFHRSEQGPTATPQGATWTPEELLRRWPLLSAPAERD